MKVAVASVTPACGGCWRCVNGMSNHCARNPDVKAKERFALDDGREAGAVCGVGTFAEAMVVDEASVVPVTTGLKDEELALIGCGVTTGVGAALNTAEVTPGSGVAVIGCGGVRQSVIQGARIAGAAVIIAIDPVESRRADSRRAGATHTIDPAQGNPVEQVRDLTRGRGADYAFDVVGRPELMVQAFEAARTAGTVTLVGMPAVTDTLTLPAIQAVFSGKRLRGAAAWPAAISVTRSRQDGVMLSHQMSVTTGRALRGAVAAAIVAVTLTGCQISQISSPDPASCKAAIQAQFLKDNGHLGAEPSVCQKLPKAQVQQLTQQVQDGK